MVKFYAWEEAFVAKIAAARDREAAAPWALEVKHADKKAKREPMPLGLTAEERKARRTKQNALNSQALRDRDFKIGANAF